MKIKFMVSGSEVHVFNMNEETSLDDLPPRVYTLAFSKFAGFYLQITKDKLELPTKIYGNTIARVEKCLHTYQDRTTSTGVLLTGDKGTGKTLLMSLLANEVIKKLKIPVVLIKSPYAGSEFVSFIESLGECCVVFDEFGKMYESADRHHGEGTIPQKELLSLLDGVDKTKRMIIMTENSEIDINEFMLNRPSRIYYHFRYRKLDEASITGYCEDHNVDENIVQDIVELSRRSRIFSFDMLQSIVEEQLRFNSSLETAIKDLNIDTREEYGAMIEITKIIARETEELREIYESPFINKPNGRGYTYIKVKSNTTARTGQAHYNDPTIVDEDDDNNYDEIHMQDSNLAYEKDGKLVYETEHYIVMAKEVAVPRTDYFKMF